MDISHHINLGNMLDHTTDQSSIANKIYRLMYNFYHIPFKQGKREVGKSSTALPPICGMYWIANFNPLLSFQKHRPTDRQRQPRSQSGERDKRLPNASIDSNAVDRQNERGSPEIYARTGNNRTPRKRSSRKTSTTTKTTPIKQRKVANTNI